MAPDPADLLDQIERVAAELDRLRVLAAALLLAEAERKRAALSRRPSTS